MRESEFRATVWTAVRAQFPSGTATLYLDDTKLPKDVDPNSIELRLSGIGKVPVKYDAATKTVEGNVTQKLRDTNYTVILSAKVKGRKVETRWNFNFAPNAAPGAAAEPSLPPRAAANPAAASR